MIRDVTVIIVSSPMFYLSRDRFLKMDVDAKTVNSFNMARHMTFDGAHVTDWLKNTMIKHWPDAALG